MTPISFLPSLDGLMVDVKSSLTSCAKNAIPLATSQYAAHEAQRNIHKKVLKLRGTSFQEETVLNQLLEEIVLISNRDITALENHTQRFPSKIGQSSKARLLSAQRIF